jgi:hypothetical protein
MPRHPLRAALLGLLLLVAMGVWLLWRADPQGEENEYCTQYDKQSVSSGGGTTASTYTTVCTTLGTDIMTYVHVHPLNEPMSSASLAFRYIPGTTAGSPRISWIGRDHLLVEADHVSSISKMKEKIGKVSVTYKISRD